MKAYFKSELALMANVSPQTLYRWMKTDKEALELMGINLRCQKLPPIAVQYLCNKYGITIDESIFD